MPPDPSGTLASLAWTWQILLATDAGQLLIVSATLTALGLAWETWDRAFLLHALSAQSLHEVERVHPHLPHFRTLGLVLAANAQLFLLTVLVLPGILLHADPRAWVVAGALFLLSTTVGIAAELEWHGVPEHLFAFSGGTTAAVLLELTLRAADPRQGAALLTLLTLAVLALLLVLRHCRHRRALITAGATLAGWLILLMLLV